MVVRSRLRIEVGADVMEGSDVDVPVISGTCTMTLPMPEPTGGIEKVVATEPVMVRVV